MESMTQLYGLKEGLSGDGGGIGWFESLGCGVHYISTLEVKNAYGASEPAKFYKYNHSIAFIEYPDIDELDLNSALRPCPEASNTKQLRLTFLSSG